MAKSSARKNPTRVVSDDEEGIEFIWLIGLSYSKYKLLGERNTKYSSCGKFGVKKTENFFLKKILFRCRKTTVKPPNV